jgi:iron complex outermembrane receptor protein
MAAAANAADTAAAKESSASLEEVVVTGSFIRGTPEDTAMPVEVIGLEQLRNIGSPTNIDLVKNMTEVGQVAGETNRYNSFPIGGATINLRNIGSRFTLVLFNGRRFPEQYSVAVGRFNNIAWIPNAPIGRVETLKEGGGVTYGADAVGGVVNYITRKNYEGLELKGDYRWIEDSKGDYTADVLWGKKIGDSSDFLISAGYQHRSSLRSEDRDWAKRPYFENDNALAWSTAGSPGSYLFQTQRNAAGVITPGTYSSITSSAASPANHYVGDLQQSAGGTIRDPNCSSLGGFAGWSATPTPICFFQLAQFEKLVEEQDTFNVYAEFNHQFGNSIKYHGEAVLYYQNVPDITAHPSDGPIVYPLLAGGGGASQSSTPGSSAYFVPGANPAVGQFLNSLTSSNGTTAYTAQQIADITGGNGRMALSGLTWRMFGNGGNPVTGDYDIQHNWTKFWRMTHQLTGDLPEFWGTSFKWDVALTYDHVVDHKDINDILVDRLQAALNGFGGPNCSGAVAGASGCMFFNPYSSGIAANAYSGAANPGFVGTGSYTGYTPGMGLQNSNDLISWFYTNIWLERTYEDLTFDPLITGETGLKLPGGAVSMAFGGQFRYRTEDTRIDDLDNRTVNPCATPGVQTCASHGGVFAFQRSQTVLGAPADLLAPSANGHTSRKYPAAAVFVEAQLPIFDSLNASLAGRYEKFYSDITDRDNDVFVPATSIKWQALDWVAVRGSWGKSFSQVNPPADNSASPLVTNNVLNATYGVTTNNANYSNVDVQPMKGTYFDVGFIVQAGNFQGTVDLYDIKIDDYTRTMTTTNVISALVLPGQSPSNTNLINCSSPLLNPQNAFAGRSFVELAAACTQGVSTLATTLGTGRINYFGTTDETNSGQLHTSGIDFNATFVFDGVLGGTLTPSLDVSYVLKWALDAFVVGGVTVTPAYDGVGFRNTSATRNGQGVPEYRATFALNYHNGIHNLNISARYLPSVIDDNIANFNETGARNANVGVNGATTAAGACTGAYATDTNPTSNLGGTPAGAGTGLYGANPTIPTAVGGAAGTVGYCSNQNTAILSGQEVKALTNVDLTYRLNLPAETDLALTIYNLLDTDPAFARNPINYDAGFGSPLGRNLKLQVVKRF